MSTGLSWPKIISDERGVAALEFALLAPVLLVLVLGTFEVSSLVRVTLKASQVADDLAKIVSQETSGVTSGTYGKVGTLGDYCEGATYALAPFSSSSVAASISSVTAATAGAPTLDWESLSSCPTVATSNSSAAVALAKSLGLTPNASDSAIIVKVTYTYTPVLHYVLGSGWNLTQTAFARPRSGSTISCSGC